MAVRRSNQFNADVDPALLQLIEQVGADYGPYKVEALSGYRPGDSRLHGRHAALDVNLIDPKTGRAVPNYQNAESAGAYQQFANAVYQQALKTDPALAGKLRWGGYFSGDRNTYGAMDLMHFDVGGGLGGLGMAGGSWAGGFNPQAMKTWGIKDAGGTQAIDAQMQAAGYTPEQRRNAIASIESQGSGDYGALGAYTGDPVEGRDRAYGRYQVMGKNIGPWAEQYLKQSGVTPEQFLKNPALQDKLFDAVYGGYAQKYGERGAASKWFTGSENEPNVTDVNGKLTGGTYADRYMTALGAAPTVQHPSNPTVGTPATPVAAAKPDQDKWGKAFSGAAQGFADLKAPVLGAAGNAPQLPTQAPLPNTPMPFVADSPIDQNRRNQLAQLMQSYWI